MNRLIKYVLINLLYVVVFAFTGSVHATVRVLNNGGGTNASNALEVTIADSTQMQIKRLGSGQLYQPGTYPSGSYPYNSLLDNGVYIRYNNRIYGANHFAYSAATIYNSFSISSVQPGSTSQGVTQSTTSSLSLTSSILSSPTVSIVWKYTYPLDYITAEVTVTIPATATVSTGNPIRYYHAVDTYLGGNDNGCGVRYTDTNGKLVVGTYPLTNGTCPSSTSLPANLDVVESFRERNGKFDHHCVGYWSDFWSTATSNPPACSISKSGSLADSITTTYQDTGAAIEFDFTTPGIYTFSYDFVVGSTFVPNYDHFEIRHAGTATLCPTEVKVLACLSSTVPCPDDQLVSSGELKGSLTVSPTTPTVTDTPDPFTLGSNQSIGTVTMQGSAAATYTLGVSGLTKTPLSGVKCWNTTTSSQNCSFTFTNTPCVNTFECMENSLTYNNRTTNSSLRNPLYTKVIGADFDIDVVALLANGNQSAYNSTTGLTVQLVSDNAGACGATVVATKALTFAASDGGRKKVTFSASDILRPHPNLRCKVTDAGLAKTGCSSDNFAIRPTSLSVTSVSPQQLSPSHTSAPVRRAGTDAFSVTVSTNELTYTGTPKVDSGKLETHAAGVTSVGQVNGTFGAANLGVSSGSTFTYSEVGHFRFKVEGIYDDTYAAVDSANGDCENSFADTDDTRTPKKLGCKFGNKTVSNYIGRFIPDHFKVTAGTSYTDGCGTFTYYDQDPGLITPFVLEAKNAADVTTQYYTGNYAVFGLSNWNNYSFQMKTDAGTPITSGATIAASSVSPSGTWGAGIANVQAGHKVTRPASAVPPEMIRISAQPSGVDGGVTVSSATRVDVFTLSASNPTYPAFRFGRLAVTSAHGSELLPLSVPIEAQYWNGTGFKRNINDSCTTIPLSSIVMTNYRGNLNACETQLTGASSMNKGVLYMRLSAPGVTGTTPNTGSVDLEVNLRAAGGGEMTCNSASQSAATSGSIPWFGATDPIGRATFGIYKAPIIYMRENF
ncbi:MULTISPECIES: DUF6701 domain-containing protein [unclassified Methylophilus]|uniref:DUF6701 domain-containing protein n=1 Tax=unclassified Methylophilus TaxID=2630143 RepID=UPI00039D64C0|nr:MULTISPECIES: DUF6701 domain-containing protein [unclassified Methylophilus]